MFLSRSRCWRFRFSSGDRTGPIFFTDKKSNPVCLLVFLGLLFYLEGYMIWRLLRLSGNDATLRVASGIRLSDIFIRALHRPRPAGSPQLYEMCKDGNNASDSTVVLMVVALFYKLVLVVIGLMLPVVWLGHMRGYLLARTVRGRNRVECRARGAAVRRDVFAGADP